MNKVRILPRVCLILGLLFLFNAQIDRCFSQSSANALPKSVANLIKRQNADTVVGLVVLDKAGKVVFAHNSDVEMPTASSIKPAILVELFAKYSSELEKTKREDIARIVNQPNHPSIAHFSTKGKTEIKRELETVSIWQLGQILIDSKDQTGKKYSNLVYNAASNVAIALLGGPEEATRKIQQRHEKFSTIHVRRYMLAARDVTGDNTATPEALAAVFRMVVGKTPKGLDSKTVRKIVAILHAVDYKNGDVLYAKGGTLTSDPVTHVRSGQYKKGGTRMNYAIMAKQKMTTSLSGTKQIDGLKTLTLDIYSGLKNNK